MRTSSLLLVLLTGLLLGGCIINTSSVCDGVTCSYHGSCHVVLGDATCSCDNGYVESGLSCVPNSGKADVQFTWAFDVGGYTTTSCSTSGVYDVDIQIKDLSGNLLWESNPTPACTTAGATVTNWDVTTYNLVLKGVCSDYTVGYKADVNMQVTHSGLNDYGQVVLDDVGGCP